MERLLEAFKLRIETLLHNCISKSFSSKPTRLLFDKELFKLMLRIGPDPEYEEVEDLI